MSRENNQEQQAKPKVYAYLRCQGKWVDDGNGRRRESCTGGKYALDAPFNRCPHCGEMLVYVESHEQPFGVKRCAIAQCAACPSRERSPAVNDWRCVGKEQNKDLCKSCACSGCCQGLLDDMAAVKGFGLPAVMAAQAALFDRAREAVRAGRITDEVLKRYLEDSDKYPVLKNTNGHLAKRWFAEAEKAVRKEPPAAGGAKTAGSVLAAMW